MSKVGKFVENFSAILSNASVNLIMFDGGTATSVMSNVWGFRKSKFCS